MQPSAAGDDDDDDDNGGDDIMTRLQDVIFDVDFCESVEYVEEKAR